MPKFKAKIPFAYENLIFNPSDKEPHDIDNDSLVNSWAEVGYCEIVGESEVKKEEQPKADLKAALKADYDDLKPLIEDLKEKVEEVEEQPKTEEKTPFDSMSYPQLKKAAKEANIKGYQNMSKDKLIELLKGE